MQNGQIDHYKTLGVDRLATFEEIKNRYRQLVLQLHPDKSQNLDTSAYEQVSNAWKVLKDANSRLRYDNEILNKGVKEDGIINENVDLEEMEFNQDTLDYTYGCRCSGNYIINEEDLERGVDIVGCDMCSLKIRVLYELNE
ncbi:hypothetical protein BB559_005055 [Furculomyces boomerangus]|uniref:Diphthamide biosynthesis protein 4 n=2 Tax=Harpellales TaxID=61421 RepID=A0A2T9YB59_9FUNG|nr:hypothetical protein BB559_005055 [Furculomyces boomerangus]PWA00017.1 hypothetical protein BB558_003895 [Smittium angustum]PWA02475.1 hypothetical protein BB558_001361 [Smittium angustum]